MSSEITDSIDLHLLSDIHHQDAEQVPLLTDATDDEQSPYEEVAANVSNHDDPAMLCLTVRSVLVGILLTCAKCFTSQFFAFRTSPLNINIATVILLSHVIDKFLSKILPEKIFNITIISGPFSVKEHALIAIMATSADGSFSAISSITVQRLYYNHHLDHVNAILFIILMHLFALSIAGILRRYLIWPASMIWPKTLMSCCMIRTLSNDNETEPNQSRWTTTRSTFFWLMVFFQFLWYWLPGYIFPLLASFSCICMIAPYNIIFSQITGDRGLGLGSLQLDWNAWVAFLGSPIFVPFWAHMNIFVGFIIAIWVVTPLLYYTNTWQSKKMPIISNKVFDINGYYYDTSQVLDNDSRLNTTAYEIYGEVRLSAGFAVVYAFMIAGISAAIMHTILYHSKSIVAQCRSSLSDKNSDIHARLMSHYRDVPEWWYYALFLFSLGLAAVNNYHKEVISVYIIMVAMILNVVFVVPLGIMVATIGFFMNSSILSDLISGLIFNGNPLGYLPFTTYTDGCQAKILSYLLLFKAAHYMKIPPRILFPLLILCPIITSIIDYLTALYLLNHIPNICTSQNPVWRCPSVETSYSLSIIWSVVGVMKTLGPGHTYFPLLSGFVVGALLPVTTWFLCKIYPNIKWLGLIHWPALLLAVYVLPTAPTVEYPSWFLVGFVFNYVLYRHAQVWWKRYAYIFSAAMSCGVAICGFVITFAFQNNHMTFPQWWGTTNACPLSAANYSGVIPTYRDL